MKKPLPDRIAEAKAKRDKLDQRLRNMEAKAKSEARSRDTRRKIVVGAVVLIEMERDPKFSAYVRRMLAKAVTRSQDRNAVADLLPTTAAEAAPMAAVNGNTATTTTAQAAEMASAGFAVTAREKLTG